MSGTCAVKENKGLYYPKTPQSIQKIRLIIIKTQANKVKRLNENVDKQRQNAHVEVRSLSRKNQGLEVGFGLFRIIFKLPKLTQKGAYYKQTTTTTAKRTSENKRFDEQKRRAL